MSDNPVLQILDKRLNADKREEYLIGTKSGDKCCQQWKTAQEINDFQTLNDEFNQQSTHKTTNGLTNGTNGSVGDKEDYEELIVPIVTNEKMALNGFDRGYHPFKILGAKNDDQKGLLFLVMFREDLTKADLIPNHVLHQKCPQLLIKYYEKNTLWKRC